MADPERADREIAGALLARMPEGWVAERAALDGLRFGQFRLFIAIRRGWIERRRRPFRRGHWLRRTARSWKVGQ